MKFSELKTGQYFEDSEGNLMIKLTNKYALDGVHLSQAFEFEPESPCEGKGMFQGNLDKIISQLPK